MESVLIFFGIIGALFLGAWHFVGYEFRKAEEREKADQELLRLQLEKEMCMPMTRIVFELPSGSLEYMEFLEPVIFLNKVVTSASYAKLVLDTCYETGRFRNSDQMTFPSCNIMKAWLEKENK
jgi:hypothetical protein